MTVPTLIITPKLAPPTPPRRRWLRCCYQFSLRTLLLVMTLAATGCWWFLQPKVAQEELVAGQLHLQRQVRTDTTTYVGINPPEQNPPLSAGYWRIVNPQGDLVVAGHCTGDRPHGLWTIYHSNGNKAAEGKAIRGARSGVWRTWDEAGHLQSEATYLATLELPHVGPSAPIAFSCGVPMVMPRSVFCTNYIAIRHGPARGWYASGQLQFEGEYQHDRRHGPWTAYDELGNILERGQYRADRREGTWTFNEPATPVAGRALRGVPSATIRSVDYIAGRTRPDLDKLLARLAADLAGNDLRRQLAAATELEQLGTPGQPTLALALRSENCQAKFLALRALVRHNALPADLTTELDALAADEHPATARWASLAIFIARQECRSDLFPRLMQWARDENHADMQETIFRTIFAADPDRRLATFNEIMQLYLDQFDADQLSGGRSLDPRHPAIASHLTGELAPYLSSALASPDPRARHFALDVIDQIALREPLEKQITSDARPRHSIPAAYLPLVERAKADVIPLVRSRAETVGIAPGGGFFGQGGFSGCVF